MPYIKQEERNILDVDIDLLGGRIENCGQLNYAVSKLCLAYLKRKGKCYQNINDIMGALTGVQQELYRRCFAIYEDEKIKSNGDIL